MSAEDRKSLKFSYLHKGVAKEPCLRDCPLTALPIYVRGGARKWIIGLGGLGGGTSEHANLHKRCGQGCPSPRPAR